MNEIRALLSKLELNHQMELNVLKQDVDKLRREKNDLEYSLEKQQAQIIELETKLDSYEEMEAEVEKLRTFKDIIVSNLNENKENKSSRSHSEPVVKDGYAIFKRAQKELNKEDYAQLVKNAKEFNAKVISKDTLLRNVKNICSHDLYLEFLSIFN
eukprot:NODE_30_length_37342_cov_0.449507.p26 type:complete len:156 gc:universal NODE_30_length_37342_cov_0.449507:10972-11439(+)